MNPGFNNAGETKHQKLTTSGWKFLVELLQCAGYGTVNRDHDFVFRRPLKEDFYCVLNPGAPSFEKLDADGVYLRKQSYLTIGQKLGRLKPWRDDALASDETLRVLTQLPGVKNPDLWNNPAARILMQEICDHGSQTISLVKFRRILIVENQAPENPVHMYQERDVGLVLNETHHLASTAAPTIQLNVLVSSGRHRPASAFRPLEALLPVRSDDKLIVEMELTTPCFIYALWITPSSVAQPIHPWIPGDWNNLSAYHEKPVGKLRLPLKDKDGKLRPWSFGEDDGLESLVVICRPTPLGEQGRKLMRENLAAIPRVRKLSGASLVPYPHHFQGANGPLVRINVDKNKEVEEPILLRHLFIEEQLANFCLAGVCLSFGLASKKRTVKSGRLVNYFWLRSQVGTGN